MSVDNVQKRKHNDDDAMEEDATETNDILKKDVVVEPKLKMPKISQISLQKMFDKTRDQDGNIRLSVVNKIVKHKKKKQRKMGKFIFFIQNFFRAQN